MKKSKKIFLRILPILMVGVMMFTFNFVFADENTTSTNPISTDFSNLTGGQTGSSTVTNTAGKIWATLSTILQILAVAAVVFAGVRYMFASADAKADIKKQMIILVIGAILVFGASTVIKLIVDVTEEII